MAYGTRMKSFWFPDCNALWWLLLALPAVYFFQTAIHEGTHGLTAYLKRGTWPIVAPFPHVRTGAGPLNGNTLPLEDKNKSTSEKPVPIERTKCDSATKESNPRLAGWIGMPQFVDLLLVVCLSLITYFANIRSPLWRFMLRLWFFAVWIDFMFNTWRHLFGLCSDKQDWSRVMLRADIGDVTFGVITWLLWGAFLCHFIWVYWSAWGKNEVAETSFWDYRWVALVLGLLSITAIIVSLVVSDDRIDKGNAAFVIPLILQFLSAIWCVIYFGLTFKDRQQSSS